MRTLPAAGRLRVIRYSLFALVALFHVFLLLFFRFTLQDSGPEEEQAVSHVIKLVDFQEYVPPPPPETVPEEKVLEVSDQPEASEMIIETEEDVIIVEEAAPAPAEPEFLPQHKISQIPLIPAQEILDKIEYPPMALRQKKEAVVYMELYIDQTGRIRKTVVLKDPGFGFAEAARKALEGLQCEPAKANGVPVAVRFRYPIRFVLQ